MPETKAADTQLASPPLNPRHCWRALPLESLAAQAGLSPHHLQRTFRRVMGISPRQYADALRLRRLKKQLRKGDDVTTALYEAGYGSSSRLYERSDAQLGMTPATYRHGGRGLRIGYTISHCSLGRLLVGATRRGGSACYLGWLSGVLGAAPLTRFRSSSRATA